jgi:hypothetical protein
VADISHLFVTSGCIAQRGYGNMSFQPHDMQCSSQISKSFTFGTLLAFNSHATSEPQHTGISSIRPHGGSSRADAWRPRRIRATR